MGARETCNAIINALRIINGANLLYFAQNPIIQSNDTFSHVTWPNHERGAMYNTEDAFGRMLQFKGILESGSYHAILKDGAFVKVSYSFLRNELIGHSLWYWPYPFKIENSDLEEFPPIDILDIYSSNWMDMIRFRTPLRFDFDKRNEEVDHPASHLHFQSNTCRVGVQRPISFATFMKFIFKNFYKEQWEENFDMWADLPIELEEENFTHLDQVQMKNPYIGWIIDR
jgi:hypothetical protein